MKTSKKFFIVYAFTTVQTKTYSGIRWEPEPTDDDETSIPDWLAYLMLMFFLVIFFSNKR